MDNTRHRKSNHEDERIAVPGDTVTDARGIQYIIGENGNMIRKTSKRLSKKKLRQRLAAERRRRHSR